MSEPAATFPMLECSVAGPQGGQGTQAMTVGDRRQLQCKLEGTSLTSQSQVQFSNGDTAQPYAVQFLGAPHVEGDMLVQDFTSYHVGTNDLNSVQAKIDGHDFRVSPIHLDVRSVLPPGASAGAPGMPGQAAQGPTPYPMVDPLTVRAPLWWWALWIGLFLIIVGWAIRLIIKSRRARLKAKAAQVKELSPREKFQTRLRKLESQGLHLRGEYKKFALELTNIVKQAIGQEFKFPAEDQTTEELLGTLERKHKIFFNTAGGTLRGFLADLDQIKFAKTETSPQGCQGLLDQALRIGRSLYGEAP